MVYIAVMSRLSICQYIYTFNIHTGMTVLPHPENIVVVLDKYLNHSSPLKPGLFVGSVGYEY